MKTARFFKIFFVICLFFFAGLATQVFAGSVDTGNVGNLDSGTSYFFEPSAPQHTIAKFADPTALNYNKTGAMALNVVLREIQSGLVGDPPVTLPSGQVFKGSTGAVGFLSNQIAFMTTTPVISGGDYIAYNFSRLTVPGIRPIYAANEVGGVGYRSLFPVLQLWTLTRNIAYLFFAIIFVIVGLMIILGRKLDPKTVLTVQAALPKIVISLVLVTFSYAIAGFVIDIMYVVIALIFAVLDPLLKTNPTGTGQDLFNSIKNGEILFLFFAKTPWIGAFQGITEATGQVSEQIFSGILGGVVSHLLGQGAGVIIGLILAIAVFYSLFKIWLKLVMTYIQLILAVIAGPFLIMMDAIPKPGQANFSNWLKGLLGNAMIYPATILMLLISMIITAGVGVSGIGDGSFIAPLTGIGNVGVAQAIIGIGMLLSIPALLDKVPGWVGVGKGGLGELTNSWQDPLKNNWASRSALANKQAEDKVKAGMTEKRIADRLSKKYPGKVERPASNVDAQQQELVNNLLTTPGAAGAIAARNPNLIDSNPLDASGMPNANFGRFSHDNFSKLTDDEKRGTVYEALNTAGLMAGLAAEQRQVLADQYMEAFKQVSESRAAWNKYAKDVETKEAHDSSLQGRAQRFGSWAEANVGRVPGANLLASAATTFGGGK